MHWKVGRRWILIFAPFSAFEKLQIYFCSFFVAIETTKKSSRFGNIKLGLLAVLLFFLWASNKFFLFFFFCCFSLLSVEWCLMLIERAWNHNWEWRTSKSCKQELTSIFFFCRRHWKFTIHHKICCSTSLDRTTSPSS